MTTISSAFDGLGAGARRPPPLKLTWLALSALAAQLLAIAFVPDPAIRFVLPCSLVAILTFLLTNWPYRGLCLAAGGVLLNLFVMLANGGLMPVDGATVDTVGKIAPSSVSPGDHIPHSKNVLLENDDTTLPILADTIVLTLPGHLTRAISPGDVTLMLGLAVAGVELTSAGYRHRPA